MQIEIPEIIQVKELAAKLNLPVADIIRRLMSFGVLVNLNQDIDFETAAIIADEFGHELTPLVSSNFPSLAAGKKGELGETKGNLVSRPPIVTVMGHVDHGKTSLLDHIRQSEIASSEAGGITQHISVYQVEIPLISSKTNRLIIFLDTPGHSAFEAIRRYGTSITDLVVLVVAADDGVKPQTIEVINHVNEAGIPILIAVNKIDKPEADVERVKRQIAELGLVPEEWGGQTVIVPVSAKTGQGIDKLLEMIFYLTDLSELKSDPTTPAIGVVIESHISPGIGPQITVLIQQGTLQLGNYLVIGSIYGKVKTLANEKNKKIDQVKPGFAAILSGLSGLPEFADTLTVVDSEKTAKEQAKTKTRYKSVISIKGMKNSSETQSSETIENKTFFKVIMKAETPSSLEAIAQSIKDLENDDVGIKIVDSSIGDINETDVKLAKSTKAVIVGFNVKANTEINKFVQNEKINLHLFNVIYDLIDYLESILKNLMPILKIEVDLAEFEILSIFRPNKKNLVVGGIVKSGELNKHLFRILRGEKVLAKGEVVELRRGRDTVTKVNSGTECGLELEIKEIIEPDFSPGDLKEQDKIVTFEIKDQKKIYQKKIDNYQNKEFTLSK